MALWAACFSRSAATFHCPSPPQVRNAAADIVAGLTASPDGIEKLKAVQRPLIIKLWRAVGLGGESSRKALVSLVNLSHDPAVADQLLQLGAVNRVMELIRENSCPHVDLLVGRKGLLRHGVQHACHYASHPVSRLVHALTRQNVAPLTHAHRLPGTSAGSTPELVLRRFAYPMRWRHPTGLQLPTPLPKVPSPNSHDAPQPCPISFPSPACSPT